jgi:protein gp37
MPLVDREGKESYNENTGLVRDKFFYQIVPNSPNLMFLLLTKRPSNINKYIPESWKSNPPENVMFGTSPVNQDTANKLILQLLQVNGRRFLSVEPQLDSINIQGFLFNGGIDWVIQGGESGHHKRPFNLEWAYYLKQQCESTNTPYFFKQIDKVQQVPTDLLDRQFPIINQ